LAARCLAWVRVKVADVVKEEVIALSLEGGAENGLPALQSPALGWSEACFGEGVQRLVGGGHDAVSIVGLVKDCDVVVDVDRVEDLDRSSWSVSSPFTM
jgi:hypothetical protein